MLVSGGRLAFTAWTEPFPINAVLADALKRHVNAETATTCLAPFAWGGSVDPDTIRELVNDAGFSDIEPEVIVSTFRMPASADSVIEHIKFVGSRSPFFRDIVDAVSVLERDVSAAMQTYRDGTDLVMPATSHLVQARAK